MANIALTKTKECKQKLLCLGASSQFISHRAATFDQAVIYKYDNSQQNQFVYVALSRVITCHWLYLVIRKNDFNSTSAVVALVQP